MTNEQHEKLLSAIKKVAEVAAEIVQGSEGKGQDASFREVLKYVLVQTTLVTMKRIFGMSCRGEHVPTAKKAYQEASETIQETGQELDHYVS